MIGSKESLDSQIRHWHGVLHGVSDGPNMRGELAALRHTQMPEDMLLLPSFARLVAGIYKQQTPTPKDLSALACMAYTLGRVPMLTPKGQDMPIGLTLGSADAHGRVRVSSLRMAVLVRSMTSDEAARVMVSTMVDLVSAPWSGINLWKGFRYWDQERKNWALDYNLEQARRGEKATE